jgi:hypothetical protein
MFNKINLKLFLVLGGLYLAINACSKESDSQGPVVNFIAVPTEGSSSLPYLFSHEGMVLMSWVEKHQEDFLLKYTSLIDRKWSQPTEVIRGTDWFVNWADFPAIARQKDRILTHILKKSSGGTYSYDVKLNLLDDEGTPLKIDFPLHTDSTFTEHGFVTLLPYKQNSFFVSWLDGRNTGGGGHGAEGHHGAMSIRGGEVSYSGDILNEASLDNRVCDCCQTSAAITDNGPVVIYRDRSKDEVRDISIVRWMDGKWLAPVTIHKDNWKIEGCPVNGPKVDAMGSDMAVAWFTAADRKPKVKVAFSINGGEKFETPIVVSEANPAGRVDIAMIDKDNILVSWLESVNTGNQFKIIRVHKSGNSSKPFLVTTVDGSRKSGFPQMELVGDRIYLAWTHIDQNFSGVKSAFVELRDL